MTDASRAAFVGTKEYRRFREFCDACSRYRYIGLCYGPPGVGKTLSARNDADWDRVAFADPHADRGVFRTDEVPGNGCVFYTATVVNSPKQIEDDIAWLHRRLRELIRQAIRVETEPVITAAKRNLDEERDEFFVNHD
jgi:AAA domain